MLYDALISTPGMNETVKVDMRINRKQVLLLGLVIENGLNHNSAETSALLSAMPKESANDLSAVIAECLEKAGLTELNQKLKTLGSVKK